VGLMVASALRLPFSYSEPVRDHRATGLFPNPRFGASVSRSSTTSSTPAPRCAAHSPH
jgi:hypothetical protein